MRNSHRLALVGTWIIWKTTVSTHRRQLYGTTDKIKGTSFKKKSSEDDIIKLRQNDLVKLYAVIRIVLRACPFMSGLTFKSALFVGFPQEITYAAALDMSLMYVE